MKHIIFTIAAVVGLTSAAFAQSGNIGPKPTPLATQPISATALPLPTGAATESTLNTINGKLTTTANGLKVDASTSTLIVGGASAVGSAPTIPPIAIAGVDGGGLKRHILVDTSGQLQVVITATVPPTSLRANSSAYEASRIAKASAGTLIQCMIYNSKTSGQFFQLHDSATLPADTAAPVAIMFVQAQSTAAFDIPVTGMPFANGIVVCNSSTGPTKTIGAADSYYTITYR